MARYRTAKALRITAGERKWLLATMKVLETMRPSDARKVDGLMLGFDMEVWMRENWLNDPDAPLCGSVGCIKGWMGSLAMTAGKGADLKIRTKAQPVEVMRADRTWWQEPPMGGWNNSEVLYTLFAPENVNLQKVTPKLAAKAIAAFLQTGKPRFPKSIQLHELEVPS